MSNINNLNTNDELYAFARREDDTELHNIAVWNAVKPVRTYISMADPTQPADAKEARDVVEVCVMTGRPIPPAASSLLEHKVPNIRRRRFHSPQPILESKRNARNYGLARDRVCGVEGLRPSVMHHGMHAMDAFLAAQHGIPAAGKVPVIPDHETLEDEIRGLRQQLAAANANAGGGASLATDQQVTDLQNQLATANGQVAQLTTERNDMRTQLNAVQGQLTTANTQLANVTNERNVALADAARLHVTQNNIRTNLGTEVANMIVASPTLQTGNVDPHLVAREVTQYMDVDRLMGTVTTSPQAPTGGGTGGGGIFGQTGNGGGTGGGGSVFGV